MTSRLITAWKSGRAALWTAIIILVFLPPAYMALWLKIELPRSTAAKEPAKVEVPLPPFQQGADGAGSPPLSAPDFFPMALEAIWSGDDMKEDTLFVGPRRQEMEKVLRKSFSHPPKEVEVIYSPPKGTSGMFTLKVTDSEGIEGMVGIRLLRRADARVPWEVENLMVLIPPTHKR